MTRTLVLMLFAIQLCANAQNLNSPSRTVYKCEAQGKVTYSDAPCLGAKRIDVEPTRGLDKSSGAKRIGADVRAERHNEQMAEALSPIFDESARQRSTRHKRARLQSSQASRCRTLDRDIADAERQERVALQRQIEEIQENLLAMRQSFRSMGC